MQFRCARWLFFLILLGGFLPGCTTTQINNPGQSIASIRVVMDNNYPPYAFLDSQGNLQGITVEQWRLWEQHTGVKVELVGLPWGEALSRMKIGEFDVIDTIFYNEERDQYLDYSEPYADINVRIFFPGNISGIVDAGDIAGFDVAVKAGDANIDTLKGYGVTQFNEYESYEAIVQAAAQHKETIFVIDEPPGLYFLYKYGLQNQFRRSEPIDGGKFHRAVKQGNTTLLSLVTRGFSAISAAEYRAIQTRWFGPEPGTDWQAIAPYAVGGASLAMVIILALFLFNRILQSNVKKRTAELQQALTNLRDSETRFRDVIQFLPIPISIADEQGRLLTVNNRFVEQYGYSIEDIPTIPDWTAKAYPDPEYQAQALALWDVDVKEAQKNGKSTPVREYKISGKDGQNHDVEISMQPVGSLWVASFVDMTARKRAERELLNSQIFLSELVEHSGTVIYVKDAQGRYELVNRKWEATTWLKRENVIGHLDREIFPEAQSEQFIRNDQKVIEAGKPIELEEYLDLPTGRKHFITVKFPIFDPQGNARGVCGMSAEITQQKRVEEALRQSERNYREIFNATSEAIFIHKVPGGQIMQVNDPMLRMYGYDHEDDVLTYGIGDFSADIPPYTQAEAEAHIQKAIQTGYNTFEWMAKKKNGEFFWVEVSLRSSQISGEGRILAVVRDITKRKQSEEALRESEANYRSLVELSPDGIVVHSEGAIVFCNSACARILRAKDVSEILGRSAIDFVHPSEREMVLQRIRQIVSQGGRAPSMEEKFIRMDGSIVDVEVNAMPVLYEGKPAIQVVVRDITERKQMTDSLRASEEKYRTLIDTVNVGIFMSSLDGRFLQANTAVIQMAGYTNEQEFLSIPTSSVYADPQDRQMVIAELQATGFIRNTEVRSIKKDGSLYWISLSAILLRNPDGSPQAILGSVVDITERKNAEERVRHNEQRFRTLIENSTDALTLIDANGKVIYEGPTVIRLTGFTPEERTGQNAFDHVHPDDLPMIHEKIGMVLSKAGSSVTAQFRSLRKDGSYWWTEGTATNLLHDPVVRAIVVNYRDITERKLADERLRESEERFRQIVEASPMGMHTYQLMENDRLVLVGANPAADRILQLDHDALIGKTIEEAFPPLAPTELPARYRAAARQGTPWEMVQVDYDHQNIHGAYEIHAFQTGQDRMTVMFLNITDRKKAEEALRLSNERNKAIVAALPDLLFQISAKGIYLDVIAAADPQILLAQREQAIGRSITDLLPANLAALTMQKIAHTLAMNEMQIYEYSLEIKDQTMYFETRMTPMGEDSVLALVRDITERKQVEEALRKGEAEIRAFNTELEQRVTERTTQLEMANKELEAFAYSVSHDLRAPLRAIDGFSRIIEEEHSESLSPSVRNLLGRVRAESRQMGQLIDALLSLSRMSRAEMRADQVNLSEMAQSIAEELQQSHPERSVEWVIASEVTGYGDFRLLHVVLENLLGNAWKFSAKRSPARIEFGVLQAENDELQYYVRDNGAGFSMAYANKLFGAFQRLHATSEFEGTGIGLATVQRIILRHGGRVWAAAEVDQGATFFFTLGNIG